MGGHVVAEGVFAILQFIGVTYVTYISMFGVGSEAAATATGACLSAIDGVAVALANVGNASEDAGYRRGLWAVSSGVGHGRWQSGKDRQWRPAWRRRGSAWASLVANSGGCGAMAWRRRERDCEAWGPASRRRVATTKHKAERGLRTATDSITGR